MPRKGNIPKKKVLPDAKYDDTTVAKLINKLTQDGKKSKAEGIIYGAFETVEEKTKTDPLLTFKKAVDNIRPVLEVKSRRVGGATYQVPVDIRPERKLSLALRWLVKYSRARGEKSMAQKMAAEILDAAGGRGGAVKKKEDTHRMAESNKAFAHYRW
ncbi:MAG: 30S ribosomal protein S7 [Thermodesulfobacteriota bacterium]